MTIDFTIRQNSTGKTRVFTDTYDDDYPLHTVEFLWSEGNYSCDCNRAIFFHNWGPESDDRTCGHTDYAVMLAVVRETGQVICRYSVDEDGEDWTTPDPE